MTDETQIFTLQKDRIRFHGVETERTSDGRCHVEVHLSLPGGAQLYGNGSGPDDDDGLMKAGAEATVDALLPVLRGRLELAYEGARLMEAFGSTLVIVSVTARGANRDYALIGAVAAPDGDLVHGAALSVLDSSNRLVEKFILGADGRD